MGDALSALKAKHDGAVRDSAAFRESAFYAEPSNADAPDPPVPVPFPKRFQVRDSPLLQGASLFALSLRLPLFLTHVLLFFLPLLLLPLPLLLLFLLLL